MQPNNVENRCTLRDSEYTSAVDEGRISPDQFVHDKFGYGLCQWTFWSRKAELWKMANARQVSISDEAMQCDLCLTELARDYSALYQQLCSCTEEGLQNATEAFCRKFENPDLGVAQMRLRYQAALQFYATAVKIEQATAAANNCTGDSNTDACPINVGNVQEGEPYMEIGVPPLKRGTEERRWPCCRRGSKRWVITRESSTTGLMEFSETTPKKQCERCRQRATSP